MIFNTLQEIVESAKNNVNKNTIAVAAAEDKFVLLALKQATELGIVNAILIGDQVKIRTLCQSIGFNPSTFEIIEEPTVELSCNRAVDLIKEKKATILMKGMVPTATLLKTFLHREKSFDKPTVLSHFALFQLPTYHKLLGITDAAMNIAPDLNEKVNIIKNATEVMRRLGIDNPKVAILTPIETVNSNIESTIHAAIISQMSRRGQIPGCIVDGPLALDLAVSREAALHKKITSSVAGDADILLAPDLNSGNILYKSLAFLANGVSAALITGGSVPIVLTSRSDSDETKLYSIALAASLKNN